MWLATNVPLASLTTLRLGGPAREVAVLDDPGDFPELVAAAGRAGSAPRVIGAGSNLLAADDGYPGLVGRMATTGVRLDHSQDGDRVLVTVQAGHDLDALVAEMVAEGLSGIECLTGIPGTVGATPVQNVGAYGQEVSDTLANIRAWDWTTGQETEMIPAHCGLGHRTSVFKHSKRWTILTVTLALTPSKLGPPLTYRAVADAAGVPLGEQILLDETVAAIRQVRDEKGMILDSCGPDGRTAGSVFLSPSIPADTARHLRGEGAPVNDFPDGKTRVSASWLMGAAGFSLGQRLATGARISTRHFTLVAGDGATAASFADAAATVAEQVQRATGITLTAEPDLLGDLPAYARLSPHGS
ncbi:UDP-N-acetylmuramate dehydrogenase [Frankia sp. Cr1]|uniref:UDP-N-acetylmuramate dehydrogenase n=1 Tax=Frankia sp. Cr1 TaxID=3073931 RepID=UPI002AD36172|nr:UDP-N-acetylmuramate dehydrogenase [Frankia sp. Cr1]